MRSKDTDQYIFCQVLGEECDKPRGERDPGYGMCRNCPVAKEYTRQAAIKQVTEQGEGSFDRIRANRYSTEGYTIFGGNIRSITVFMGTIGITKREAKQSQ